MILILCTGNSCRSHMAEGILQQALGPEFEVASAGWNPAGCVHPLAIAVALAVLGIESGVALREFRGPAGAGAGEGSIKSNNTPCTSARRPVSEA